jgi:hypothetical protein
MLQIPNLPIVVLIYEWNFHRWKTSVLCITDAEFWYRNVTYILLGTFPWHV